MMSFIDVEFCERFGFMAEKAFIFDMDGVIIDSEKLHSITKVQAIRSFGVEVREAELNLESYVGRSAKSFFSDVIGKYPELGDDWEVLAKKKHELYQKILREDPDLKPIDGIPELLDRLKEKGYRIGLGSSSVMANIQLVLGRFGILIILMPSLQAARWRMPSRLLMCTCWRPAAWGLLRKTAPWWRMPLPALPQPRLPVCAA